MSALLALGADTAVAEPPSDGAVLFRKHCQVCHGRTATDGEAGDIRGMPLDFVRSALRGFEQMPSFDFTDAEVAAITAHLARLGQE